MKVAHWFLPLTENNVVERVELKAGTILKFIYDEYDKDRRGFNLLFEVIGEPVKESNVETVYHLPSDSKPSQIHHHIVETSESRI